MTKFELIKEMENLLDSIDLDSFYNVGDYAFTLGVVISKLEQLIKEMESDF